MKIAIGVDHGGFSLKEAVCRCVEQAGHEVLDMGCSSADSVDYPDYAAKVIEELLEGRCDRGILICGTGIGMSIVANRSPQIRAALCHDLFTAQMSREHNDANVLCLGARVLEPSLALSMVDCWLKTEFAGGRHQRRIDKIRVSQ